ncbi:hypothetical protein [Floridanema evergladense]|uniref:Uncharacterized protein n=1 Tax=Floridaenema evergladense BLCC-F167 TaxID=3153639 RepID=A0ABV4WQT1_9CYAN
MTAEELLAKYRERFGELPASESIIICMGWLRDRTYNNYNRTTRQPRI